MENENETFRIPQGNQIFLEKKLETLNKRARKIGCPEIELKLINVETKKEMVLNSAGFEVERIYVWNIYEIHGDAPIINGWELNATLEHLLLENGEQERLVKTVPGKIIPSRYRVTGSEICEHCNKKIRRKNTYVLRNIESEEFKAVGSGCIRDFLGHTDPKAIAKWAEFRQNLITFSIDEGEGFSRHFERSVSLKYYMYFVCESIQRHGWISKKKYDEMTGGGYGFNFDEPNCQPTSWNAIEQLWPPALEKTDFYGDEFWSPSPESIERGDKILEWCNENILNKVAEEGNEYLYNLQVILKAGYVDKKSFGLAASLPPWYFRDVESKAVEENKVEKPSEWIGNIKDRLDFIVKVVYTKPINRPTFSFRDSGVSYLVKMVDNEGNNLTWFSSNNDMEEGKSYKLLGTVKEHKDYKGEKQTVITRCKIKEELS